MHIVERLEAASQSHRWLISATSAQAAGLPEGVVARLHSAGRWRRIARGVYAVAGRDGGPLQHAAAQLYAAGPLAHLEASAAAAVHGGLDLEWDGTPTMFVHGVGAGARKRRRVPANHLTVVRGLRCTDGLLTLLDLAKDLDPVPWEWALEAALRQRLTTIRDITDAMEAAGPKDRKAVATVRVVLALRADGAPPTASILETRFLQNIVRPLGLPDPERQHEISVGSHAYRTDFAWTADGIFTELDGEGHKDQPVHDADRETAIAGATGWLCARLTWTHVVRNPRLGRDRLRRIFEQARRRPLPPDPPA